MLNKTFKWYHPQKEMTEYDFPSLTAKNIELLSSDDLWTCGN